MKKKLSLLLVMVMALTMVLGTGVCAWAADPNPTEVCLDSTNPNTTHFYYNGHNYTSDDGKTACCGYMCFYNIGGYYNCTEITSGYGTVLFEKLNGSRVAGWYYAVPSEEIGGSPTWSLCSGNHITAPGQAVTAVAPCAKPVLEQPVYVAAPHVHEWVEGVIYDATADADGLEGVYCKTCGAIRESSLISAYSYTLEKYALEKINAAKPGQTITFEFGELNSFPKSFMEKLVAKSAQGVTFVFKYKVNHELQTITIPAGTHINLDFDWYGYAKMAALYGMY